MAYKVGVDIGGTFTDFAVIDEQGNLFTHKSPSTPQDPSQAVMKGMEEMAPIVGTKSAEEFLAATDLFFHGTTVATNTAIQRKGAKTGLITTKGFEYVLYIRDGHKPDLFNQRMPVPEPYIERYLTFGVGGRINYAGEEAEPLNEDEVRAAVRQMKEWNVKAVAICLLWSFMNPAHERRVAQIFAEEYPEAAVSISYDVQPRIREYPRTCATALNASLIPVMTRYINNLQNGLKGLGYKRDMLLVQSTSGVVPGPKAALLPVFTLMSGPSMGPAAGIFYGQGVDSGNVITIDMGGTSFDVAMVTGSIIKMATNSMITDIPTGVLSTEVVTLGAGGGSISWLDPGKMLHVGPQSSGADPGPACYLKGGTEPTTTDANVVLGYLNPDYFLGGRMKIDPKLSANVVKEKIADPLGISTIDAAAAIFTIVNQNMVAGMESISIKRGIDPRKYLCAVGGGATSTHACRICEALQMKRIIIPREAGVFCALGMLISDIKHEYVRAFFTKSDEFNLDRVNQIYREMEAQATEELLEEGVTKDNIVFERWVEARYVGQIWEITVPVPSGEITPDNLQTVANNFHDAHKELYTYSQPELPVEFITWRLTAKGLVPKISLKEKPVAQGDASVAQKGQREIYLQEEKGMVSVPIYDGNKLHRGMSLEGPAVVEVPTQTIVVTPKWKVNVTKYDDFLLEYQAD